MPNLRGVRRLVCGSYLIVPNLTNLQLSNEREVMTMGRRRVSLPRFRGLLGCYWWAMHLATNDDDADRSLDEPTKSSVVVEADQQQKGEVDMQIPAPTIINNKKSCVWQ